MLIVLSLNTAVDRTLLVPYLRPGRVHRATRAHRTAGGKGLNVARALRRLGMQVRVIGFLGGVAAPFVHEQCAEIGIEQRWVDIADESRTCVIAVDEEAGGQTVLNEPGPQIQGPELDWLRDELELYGGTAGDILCISGSAPPGVGDGFYAEVVRAARARDVRVLVDASGESLRRASQEHPWAVAPNLREAVDAFGERGGPEALARGLGSEAEHVLITLGARGVVYVTGGECTALRPPAVRALNAVGSGDALVAGFLAGISEGLVPIDAARLGVACGASNAARFEPDVGSREEVEALAAEVTAEPDGGAPPGSDA